MANRLYIDSQSKDALNLWTENNPGFVLSAFNFFSRCEMYLVDIPGKCYVDAEKDSIRIDYHANKDNGLPDYKNFRLKMNITRTPDGPNDYGIHFGMSENAAEYFRDHTEHDALEDAGTFVRLIAESYLMANVFLIYGNLTEQDSRVLLAQGKNEDKDKVIIFRVFEGSVYAAENSRHRSPEGVFSVRGHFRRYKSGKVVWIDQYLKGL